VRLDRVVLASAALAAFLLAACTRAAPSSPPGSEGIEQRSSALTSNVTVTVVNTAGTPQAGRFVYPELNGVLQTAGTTNASGQVTFTLNQAAYRFAVPGEGTGFFWRSGAAGHCVLPGCTAATVTVTQAVDVLVVDADNNPMVNAQVLAWDNNDVYFNVAFTNSQGHVSLSTPVGAFRFAVPYGGIFFKSGAVGHCAVPGCTSATVVVTWVNVTVVDTDGIPLVNKQVLAEDTPSHFVNSGYTNSSGQVTVAVPQGPFRFVSPREGVFFPSGAIGHCVVSTCRTATISIPPPVVVTAVDACGTPVGGSLYIVARNSQDQNVASKQATNGTASLTVLQGGYRFAATMNNVVYYSGPLNSCTVPGCTTATIVRTSPACNPCSGQPDGTACNDGNACTQGDTCQSGSCQAGAPVTCTASDQCHDVGTCNTSTGACSNPAKANGASCNDGNACTQTDTCQSGSCQGSNPVTCMASDQCHTAGTCDTATGVCSNPAKANGTACNDNDACTQTDTCQSGSCSGSNPVTCTASDQCHTAGTCNPANGQCSNPLAANGTACSDGNACTQPDTCQSGSCQPGTPVTCTASDQCHVSGTCDPANGTCSNPVAANGTTCSDGNSCTSGDTCQSGACAPGSDVTCPGMDQCHFAGTCSPGTGTCAQLNRPDGTACDDSNSQTLDDACQSGACVGTPGNDPCANKADLDPCDDGNACTSGEYCNTGVCGGGTPTICNPGGDECQNYCNPATGACTGQPAPNGASCEDGDVCTTGEACQAGHCGSGGPVDCAPLACYGPGTCDPAFGGCHYPQLAAGTSCDDQNACTLSDTCDSNVQCFEEFCFETFGCVGHDPITCSPSNECRVASCDPATGGCVDTARPDDVLCDDSNSCTYSDACQGGSCGGSALTCVASDTCHDSGVCDPATGLCSDPVRPDGTSCDDGTSCSENDSCHGGLCSGTPVANCGLVAPPIDRTVATDFAAETSFLYSGASPVQTGVASGAVDALRVGVVHGRVLDVDNSPLVGVTVKVHDHPEFGTTLTQGDGRFYLVLNGGGTFSIEVDAAGKLPVQRQVVVPVRDYVDVPDVVLIELDPEVTIVDLPNGVTRVAQGSVVSDADGTRQATLIVPAGTTATMVNADGSTTELSRITVRTTEYTVGPNGPAAMPAGLPPTSAYTYAVENSVDEALAAGAKSVVFNQPIAQYVDNFLGFAVGTVVPSGFYDRERATWVAEPNGVVVKVVDVVSGLAELDSNGDDIADDAATLASLGVTDEERVQLASLYLPGQTLWRVPLEHFSPCDYNWPDPGPPEPPRAHKAKQEEQKKDPCEEAGSIIECENQVLGERLPIVGTPFSLNYRSSRVDGNTRARQLQIPLGFISPLAGLFQRRIDVKVEVAGNVTTRSFPVFSNQEMPYQWDGRDGFGRALQGSKAAHVTIGYVYPGIYGTPGYSPAAFAEVAASPTPLPVERTLGEIVMTQQYDVAVGAWSALAADRIGGWTLSVHHHYEPERKILHLGTGRDVDAAQISRIITRYAGTGHLNRPNGDGIPGSDPDINPNGGLVVGPDGSLYVGEDGCVRRVAPNGTVSTYAGAGLRVGAAADGFPATDAYFYDLEGLSVGPDGSLYFLDLDFSGPGNTYVLWRVKPNGIMEHLAGKFGSLTGTPPTSGNGMDVRLMPLQSDSLRAGQMIAVAPDGSIYIVESRPDRDDRTWIRRVGTDGNVSIVVGAAATGPTPGQDIPARDTSLRVTDPIAVDGEGNLYFVEAYESSILTSQPSKIRKVGGDGILRTVAESGTLDLSCASSGDGTAITGSSQTPPTPASFHLPTLLVATRDGSLLFQESCSSSSSHVDGGVIRKLTPDGALTTVAGRRAVWPTGLVNNNEVANASAWSLSFYGMTQGPSGETFGVGVAAGNYFDATNTYNSGLYAYKISDALPVLVEAGAELRIPAEDGSEVYVFDHQGRHLRTEDALFGSVRYQFGYTNGYLTSVQDVNSLVTQIERNSALDATAIVAPNGQRTVLSVGPGGDLASVTNPANESTAFTYYPKGLLKTEEGPTGATHTFHYDDQGQLIGDDRPGGGSWNISRTQSEDVVTVSMTSAEGRSTSRSFTEADDGPAQNMSITAPTGLISRSVSDASGAEVYTDPDGTIIKTIIAPDPRFGMAAPYTSARHVTMGVTRSTTTARNATINPSSGALVSQVDTVQTNGRTTTVAYDAATRTRTTTSPAGRQSVRHLDASGRTTLLQRNGLAPIALAYDSRGRTKTATWGTGVDARVVTWDYDALDRPALFSAPSSLDMSPTYDLANRPTALATSDGRTLSFGYDHAGRPTSLTPPGQPAHITSYDDAGNQLSYTPPFVPGAPGVITQGHNLDGDLTSIQRPDGTSVTLSYDTGGRLASTTYPAGPGPAAGTITVTGTYGSGGKATQVSSSEGAAVSFTYDGALMRSMTSTGPVVGTVGRSYDTDFRLATETLNGASISFGYDPDGLIMNAGNLSMTRDPTTGLVMGTTLAGISDTRSYNAFGEPATFAAGFGSTPLYNVTFHRDGLGRIDEKTETIGGSTDMYIYAYDSVGRLWQVMKNGQLAATYEYDLNDNRTLTTTPSGQEIGVSDDQDRMASYGHWTFTYTPNGEVRTKTDTTSGAVTTYDYDGVGALRRVHLPDGRLVAYDVDVFGQRVAKRINGAVVHKWLYGDRLHVIAELDASNAVVTRVVAGEYLTRGGATYRIVKDQVGSFRLVVNASTGEIAQRIDYDPWGRVLNDTAPGFQPFGFAGGLYDPDTGLTRFGTRDYDPETGRWLSKDSIGFSGHQTNLYLYSQGDPINRRDPTGRDPAHFWFALAAMFAFGVDTDPYGAVFWSGELNFYAAKWFAMCTGGKTLEMTPGGIAIDALTSVWGVTGDLTTDEITGLWTAASFFFAAGASGGAVAWVGLAGGGNPNGFFWNIEAPMLMLNEVPFMVPEFWEDRCKLKCKPK
jgi:RHS repeat-associated protein